MNSQIKYPSVHELEQYHNGSLDASRSHEIERLSLEDPFVADALEGFSQKAYFHAVPHVSQLIALGANEVSKTGLLYTLRMFLNRKTVLGAIILGAVIIALFTLTNKKTNSEVKSSSKQESRPQLSNQQNQIAPVASSHDSITNSPISKEKRNSSDSLQLSPKLTMTENFTDKTQSEQPNEKELTDEKFKYVGVAMKYIGNYKILDYTDVYSNDYPQPSSIIQPSDTTAVTFIPYFEFITIMIDKLNDKKYQEVELICKWMLERENADNNALYFGAISAYQLHKYEEAKLGFSKVLSSTVSVNKQEAKLYLEKIAIQTP